MVYLAGPFTSEFGYELYNWQSHLRWLKRHRIDKPLLVAAYEGRCFLHRDYADEVIPISSNYLRDWVWADEPDRGGLDKIIGINDNIIQINQCARKIDKWHLPPHRLGPMFGENNKYLPYRNYTEDIFVQFQVRPEIRRMAEKLIPQNKLVGVLVRFRGNYSDVPLPWLISLITLIGPERVAVLTPGFEHNDMVMALGGAFNMAYLDIDFEKDGLELSYALFDRCRSLVCGPVGYSELAWFSMTPQVLFGNGRNFDGPACGFPPYRNKDPEWQNIFRKGCISIISQGRRQSDLPPARAVKEAVDNVHNLEGNYGNAWFAG